MHPLHLHAAYPEVCASTPVLADEAIIVATEGPLERAIAQANAFSSERSFSTLERTLTAVLARVAEDERREATEAERLEKLALRRRRRHAADLKKAEVAAAAAAQAVAEAEAAEAAARPLTEKVTSGLGGLFSTAVSATGEALVNALDPARQAAEEAARAADAAAAAAEATAEEERRAEAKRQRARMKRQAPAAESFSVRLVRGFSDALAPRAASSALAARPRAEAGNGVPADPAGPGEAAADAEGFDAVRPPSLPRERSRLVGSTIYVDADHPDFQARWRQTRQGAPKVDDRLCGYLATVVSSHYRERAYQAAARSRVDYAQCYEEMIGTYCRLEDGLRAVLPQMLKEITEQGGYSARTDK